MDPVDPVAPLHVRDHRLGVARAWDALVTAARALPVGDDAHANERGCSALRLAAFTYTHAIEAAERTRDRRKRK